MGGQNTNDLYRECQRNHAANLGSHATDGCGEFMLDQTSPAALLCAACGCHRNFHRKLTYGAAHGGNHGGHNQLEAAIYSPESKRSSKLKRHRTKFTPDLKEKMQGFAEKLGWKLQRNDQENEVEKFCRNMGVSRKVFKVWMHNHKNSASAGVKASSSRGGRVSRMKKNLVELESI